MDIIIIFFVISIVSILIYLILCKQSKIKILILIISSDKLNKRWTREKRVWKKYMNLDKNITCKFITCKSETIDEPSANDLQLECTESFIPGIYLKTIKALKKYQNKYDYYIRTNLSTFIAFDRLKTFLNTYKPTYTGHFNDCRVYRPDCQPSNLIYGGGTSITLNNRANNILLEHAFNPKYIQSANADDALIGQVLSEHGVAREKYNVLHEWNENEPFVANTEGADKIFFRLKYVSDDNINDVSTHLLNIFN